MNTRTYTHRGIRSPLQQVQQHRDNAFNVQQKEHPIRKAIRSLEGEYTVTARFEEDTDTIRTMPGLKGLIAFLCTLTNSKGETIGTGRGSALLSPKNKYMDRLLKTAFNSALVDAVIRSAKVLDTFAGPVEEELPEDMQPAQQQATEKQVRYLEQLIQTLPDEQEREHWQQQLTELTKQEASDLIARFRS